jgi:hypothetical protein
LSSELAKRVAFAVVAAPLTVAVVFYGGLPLALLLSVVAGLGAGELFRMAQQGGVPPLLRAADRGEDRRERRRSRSWCSPSPRARSGCAASTGAPSPPCR